jgi:MFS family permease
MNRVVVPLLVAHVFSLLGFATYAAVLPLLEQEWQMSNTEAGWVASAFFVGYVATVSTASALTDRIDARRVYFVGALFAASSSFLFAWAAHGVVTAILAQALLGAGNAATYMPGLRMLADRGAGENQSRYISFYTSFFGIGVACSLWFAGHAVGAIGWRLTFAASGAGPLLAAALVAVATRGIPLSVASPSARGPLWSQLLPLRAWKEVLADRNCLTYTLGYAFHCLELFGMRAWMVAFLDHAASVAGGPQILLPVTIAAAGSIVSAPSSILGNELALKVGRRRWIHLVMRTASFVGVVMAISAQVSWALAVVLVFVYGMGVMADSATLTAGLVAAAPQRIKGAALGLYSFAGFGVGGITGPALFGATLDIAGAWPSASWALAFLALGLPCFLFPWIDTRLHGAGPARVGEE